MNESLYKHMSQVFHLSDYQIKSLLKVNQKIVRKAWDSTQRYKPGDLQYFKGSLKHYQKLKKPVKAYEVQRSTFTDFQKLKDGNDKVLEKISQSKHLFDCEICGVSEFHSRLKHEWLNTKKIIEQRNGAEILIN